MRKLVLFFSELEYCLCTSPVATVLFSGCSIAKVSITEVQRPMLPMYLSMLAVLLLVTFIPKLSLWVPRWFGLWHSY